MCYALVLQRSNSLTFATDDNHKSICVHLINQDLDILRRVGQKNDRLQDPVPCHKLCTLYWVPCTLYCIMLYAVRAVYSISNRMHAHISILYNKTCYVPTQPI